MDDLDRFWPYAIIRVGLSRLGGKLPLPLPVRQGEPAGTVQVAIGQSLVSTRLKASLTVQAAS
ncbi:hypothetical protein ADK76_31180 [Streptomyces griseoflavus]|uniref:hypothetical protein n=1 Tax=Streptomyces rimosus TaxID=1927 RepID=UPI0004C67D04|nr:hypothetical protein [Streptomyces rimosus]KOG52752.1 hypothetical protein ADK76_31180 [Streptomyces griseoflavus]